MTSNRMSAVVHQNWRLNLATFAGNRTSRREGATWREVKRAWHFPGQRFDCAPHTRVWVKCAFQKSAGVWVTWRSFCAWQTLDHTATMHHQNFITEILYQRQVMRDENICKSQLILKIFKQIDDLCLNGNIKCRGGLVSDQQVRISSLGPWR